MLSNEMRSFKRIYGTSARQKERILRMKTSVCRIFLLLLMLPFLPSSLAQIPGGIPAAAPVIPQSEYLLRSGVAYDASEDLLGIIQITEPKSFFKPETDQVTWWGEFKPFKTWGTPELEAKWYDPAGRLITTQNFKGSVCRLAKTTLKTADLNLEQNQGRWRVDISMKGKPIDSKHFYIFSPKSGQPVQNQGGITVQMPSGR